MRVQAKAIKHWNIREIERLKYKSQVFKTLSEIRRLSIISDVTMDTIKYLEVL